MSDTLRIHSKPSTRRHWLATLGLLALLPLAVFFFGDFTIGAVALVMWAPSFHPIFYLAFQVSGPHLRIETEREADGFRLSTYSLGRIKYRDIRQVVREAIFEDDEPRTRVCVSGNFGEKCWIRHAGETPKTRAALDEFEALLREKTPHATHIQRDFPDDAESLANSEDFLPFEACNSTAIWALILAIWVIFASIVSYFFFELSPLEMLKGLMACLILTFWDSQTQISASGITHRKFLWRRQFSWDEIERLEARDWFLLAHTSRGAVRLPPLGAFGLRARELFLFLRANGKLKN